MDFLSLIIDFIKNLFGLGGEGGPTRSELRKLAKRLSQIHPPYYRFSSNMVLPGFAWDLFRFCSALKPLMDLADRTVAHPDMRISQRYFDHLLDRCIPDDELAKKDCFSYEGMKARVENAIKSEGEPDRIDADFRRFLGFVTSLPALELNVELLEVERLSEICRHDWERTLGFFDPGASLDSQRYAPDFQGCEGEQILPEIVDAYYLLYGFHFSDALLQNVLRLLERYSPAAAQSQRAKVEKIFLALNKLLEQRLTEENLITLVRLAKGDPLYLPDTKRLRKDYIEHYRRRLVAQYERDRDRFRRERHESEVAHDIQELFGNIAVHNVEDYNEENDGYLRRENPNGFTHLKPLGILKTFVFGVYEPFVKEHVKRILVEGYFDNKNYQNNLANILFQCDRTAARITTFEASLRGSGRISISALRRYVEELRHGKDIGVFLNKIVDDMNLRAKDICEDETGLFRMLGDALAELLLDYRKPSPDLVTNIRTLGGGRNKEIISHLQESKVRVETFVRVMRSFLVPKGAVEGGRSKAAEDGAGSPLPTPADDYPADASPAQDLPRGTFAP